MGGEWDGPVEPPQDNDNNFPEVAASYIAAYLINWDSVKVKEGPAGERSYLLSYKLICTF